MSRLDRSLQKRILELEEELATLRAQLDQPVRHRMPDTRIVVDPQVRDRRSRRLHHRRPVRRRPAGRALHHHVEGRQHHRRPDGHRRHAHLDRAAIRRAAGEPGEEVRLSTIRAERVHQESRHPQRDQHHRLRFPLARLPVHQRLQGSDFAESRPARVAAEGNSGDREESAQPPGLGSARAPAKRK